MTPETIARIANIARLILAAAAVYLIVRLFVVHTGAERRTAALWAALILVWFNLLSGRLSGRWWTMPVVVAAVAMFALLIYFGRRARRPTPRDR